MCQLLFTFGETYMIFVFYLNIGCGNGQHWLELQALRRGLVVHYGQLIKWLRLPYTYNNAMH